MRLWRQTNPKSAEQTGRLETKAEPVLWFKLEGYLLADSLLLKREVSLPVSSGLQLIP